MLIALPSIDSKAFDFDADALNFLAETKIRKPKEGSEFRHTSRPMGFHEQKCKWRMFYPSRRHQPYGALKGRL
jgi:hypothetical protein